MRKSLGAPCVGSHPFNIPDNTTAAGQGQYAETYGYDWLGNIVTRTISGQALAYTYGRRYGLSLPAPAVPVTGAHRIYLPLVARNFDAGFQQPFAVVATSAGFRAGYDRNGNMLVRVEISGTEIITYTQEWNVENRLSVVTNTVTGDVTRFVYDGDGAQVLREAPGGLTAYIGAVEVALRGTQRFTISYYFAGGQRIAMKEGGKVTYLHGEHLGSAAINDQHHPLERRGRHGVPLRCRQPPILVPYGFSRN